MTAEGLHDVFRSVFKRSAEWIAHAPGRVNLIGEHTDYNGGFVMPVAIDRGVRIAASHRPDRCLYIHATDYSQGKCFNPEDRPAPPESKGWWSYILGVCAQFEARGFDLPGLDMAVAGDVPPGAGLSSSAALEVAMAVLLNEVTGANLSRRDIALLAQAAEHSPFVGVQCGIMDQFASALGRRDHALLIDCHTLEHEQVPFDSTQAAIVIVNSMKRRGLMGSEYNRRRSECEEGLSLLRQLNGCDYETLRHVPIEDFERVMRRMPEAIRRRVRHNVTENARVHQFAATLRSGEWAAAGELLHDSHDSLRDDFEVSCPELDSIVELAREHDGAFGCRMTGAGFGGCAVALVRPGEVDRFVEHVRCGYQQRIGVVPQFYITLPCEGATVNRTGG